MAINRAPWNALIDDDGSNLVGTVWNKDKIKTVILDPVDAAFVTPVYGTWTPSDASGAGLVLTIIGARWGKIDKLVTIHGFVIYPATANGARAQIAGLPFYNGSVAGGLYTSNGPLLLQYYIAAGDG